MAEKFELVRTCRQHLKRGAALLEDGRFDDALREVEQALALDPCSVPGQALGDRVRNAKARAAAQPAAAARPPAAGAPAPAGGFVPHGVNAASWRGFEQRISDRRFHALLDTANSAIVAGDAVAARSALDEARELRADAPELAELDARLAAVPAAPPPEVVPAARIWMRAMGAAAMFLVGVSLLIGVEWLRPIDTITPAAPVMTDAPGVAPAGEFRPTARPQDGGANIEVEDGEESIPAIVTPPEPLFQPRGTTGTLPAADTRPVARNAAPARAEPAGDAAVPPAPARAEADGEVLAARDVARAGNTSGAASAEPAVDRAEALPAATEAAAAERPALEARAEVVPAAVPAAAVPAAAVPAAAVPAPDQSRVQEVLRRYASAYRALDATAARAVWPSVDEKALAHAFRNLASQDVSFDDCTIHIRGEVADASCHGQASFVGKVGSREPRTESRTWRFELRRAGEAWMIEGVDARRLSQSPSYQP